MLKLLIGMLGLIAGAGLGLYTTSLRLTATHTGRLQASGFPIGWIVVSFMVAAVFAVLAARFKLNECLLICATAMALGITWALL